MLLAPAPAWCAGIRLKPNPKIRSPVKGVDLIVEVTKQLLTLSTGILTLTVTFAKYLKESGGVVSIGFLKAAWVLYLLCILFGIWTLMAVAGSMVPVTGNPPGNVDSARLPAALQIGSFFLGTVCIVLVGVLSWRKTPQRSKSEPRLEGHLETSQWCAPMAREAEVPGRIVPPQL